jgi:hypothetical protein
MDKKTLTQYWVILSNTYCVVFLFCFSSSCLPYVDSFSGLSFFDCPFGIPQRLLNNTFSPTQNQMLRKGKGQINIPSDHLMVIIFTLKMAITEQ